MTQPSKELWDKIKCWFNEDVRLAVPFAAIPWPEGVPKPERKPEICGCAGQSEEFYEQYKNNIPQALAELDYYARAPFLYFCEENPGILLINQTVDKALEIFNNVKDHDKNPYFLFNSFAPRENPSTEIFTCFLDQIGVVSHGSGIGGAWFDEKDPEKIETLIRSSFKKVVFDLTPEEDLQFVTNLQ